MRFSRFLIAAMAASFMATALGQAPALPKPAAPATAAMPTPPAPVPSGATAWLLMDAATAQVLASENADVRLEPASITKVLTSYVVAAEMKAGKIRRDDKVRISENAWRGGGGGTDGSTSFLPLDGEVTLDDLEKAMVVQSGNDAAIALAEHVAGSTEAFAALMNAYAARIGMKNSRFANPHGLSDPGHYSTARDLALLGRAMARDFPQAYAYNKLKELTVNGITQHNRNGLLWKDPSVDGIKTGHHSGSGYCLLASAVRGDQRLVSVVMGIQTSSQAEGFRLREAGNLNLLNWGFRFFETHRLYAPGKAIVRQRLWKGEAGDVGLGVASPLVVVVPRGRYADLKPAMDVPKNLLAPLKKGQAVGTLRVSLDGKVIAQQPIVAVEDAPQAGFFGRLWDEFWLWWES